jgi:hypothetical protein
VKLHTLNDAAAVHDGEDTYKVGADGTVEVPHALGERLRDTHIGGEKQWEDSIEQQNRLLEEELARRRDPASAYELLAKIAAGQADGPHGPVSAPKASRPRTPRKAPARPAPAQEPAAKAPKPAEAKRPIRATPRKAAKPRRP